MIASRPQGLFEVIAQDGGARLDKFLATLVPELSRARAQALITDGQVRSGGQTIRDPNHRVKQGEAYTVAVPAAVAGDPKPEAIPLAVVHEDASLIVIDKPAGLVVHPAPGHASGTLVNALMAHCGDSLSGIGGVRRPGIVHRLDKDTTGLMVVAKTDQAHRALAEQFAAHGRDGRMRRAYLAIVWGAPTPPAGRIEAALARQASNRTKIGVVRAGGGRVAVTHYTTQTTYLLGHKAPTAARMRCVLETGRTHQVRVHMAHIGHPLLGDATYGTGYTASARKLPDAAKAALAGLARQALHAEELTFEHPVTGKRLSFLSPPPPDLEALIRSLSAP